MSLPNMGNDSSDRLTADDTLAITDGGASHHYNRAIVYSTARVVERRRGRVSEREGESNLFVFVFVFVVM